MTEFVAHYRELTTDLARLRTAARGRDSDAVYGLSRLVAGGHNLLYRGRRIEPRRLGHYVAFGIPAELRKVPYMLVVGDREMEEGTVSVRRHREGDEGSENVADVAARIAESGM